MPAHGDEHAGGAIEFVQPTAGWVFYGPATYYEGAVITMPFQLQGDSQVEGYVRVSLKQGDTVFKYPKTLNVTHGYLEAPLTFMQDKVRNGTHTLKVDLYNEKDKKVDAISREITIIKPEKPGTETDSADADESSSEVKKKSKSRSSTAETSSTLMPDRRSLHWRY